jgi:CubicO group peptidase (beta-lactamase class C family)
VSNEIHGFCDDRFAPMRAAFSRNFENELEIGASLAMTYRGKTVLDLWAGHADPERTRPWQENTIVFVASTTKVPMVIALLMVIDRGLIDLDATVARYWPEFAQGGKAAVTVRDVLTHQAGVPSLDPPSTLEVLRDWNAVTARIAAEPHWFGGKRRICYHANTLGFIASELIRRVDGRRPRQFFREEIADKIGADFQIGLSDEAELGRVATVQMPGDPRFEGIRAKVYLSFQWADWNEWAWLSTEYPGASGICNGRSLAKIGAIIATGGTVDGVRYLSEAMVAQAGREQVSGTCLMFGPITWGLGFGLHNPAFPAPSPTSMHWGGFGGSWALMDPKAQVSLGYAPNNFRFDDSELVDRRLGRFWHVLSELLPTL